MRKQAFYIYENKDADQLCITAQLISAFVFATWIVQSLFLLNLTPDTEVGGSSPTRCCRVVSLSKTYLPPKSTGNTQEAASGGLVPT